MKRVAVIISGSPRKNGNTAKLADSFARGVKNPDDILQTFALNKAYELGASLR